MAAEYADRIFQGFREEVTGASGLRIRKTGILAAEQAGGGLTTDHGASAVLMELQVDSRIRRDPGQVRTRLSGHPLGAGE